MPNLQLGGTVFAAGARCLVTGGAGFIGSHIVARLVDLGCDVRVVDDLSTGDEANLLPVADEIEFIRGDLRDPDVSRRSCEGMQVVFHLAALPSVSRSMVDPWGSHDANVNATMRVLEAAQRAGVQRIVYSSSSSVYGDTVCLPKVETCEPLPRSPYATSKLAGEQYVLAFARGGMIEGVALRYFNVFGPRQTPHSPYAAVIPAFLLCAAEGRQPAVFGDGLQSRDFTYVENVVDANLLAATRPAEQANGWVVNVGAGVPTTLLDLLEMIGEVTGRPMEPTCCEPRAGDVRASLAGLERANRVLGYRPAVALEEGLRRTWAWMMETAAVTAAEQRPAKRARRARQVTPLVSVPLVSV